MSSEVDYSRAYRLRSARLLQAFDILRSSSDVRESVEAFRTLLSSEELDARCIALDHFGHWEALWRHGRSNPYAGLAGEVGDVARRILQSSCVEQGVSAPDDCVRLYECALDALRDQVDIADSALVERLLATLDPDVRARAAALALRILSLGASESLERVLRRIVTSDLEPARLRETAIFALSRVRSAANEAALQSVLESPHIALQVWAGVGLAKFDLNAHRAELERVVAAWPENPRYPASELIEILEEPETD